MHLNVLNAQNSSSAYEKGYDIEKFAFKKST